MKKRIIRYKTNYLFPKNNFWVGMGSVLNISGSYFDYNYSRTENEADLKALISDWINVGEDIKESIEKFENKNKQKLCLK